MSGQPNQKTDTTWLPTKFEQQSVDLNAAQRVSVAPNVISGVVEVCVAKNFSHCFVRLSPADARELALALKQMADAVEGANDASQ